jgi:hypothetical protein
MIENLNLSDFELDRFIYRIIPYDRFINNLKNNENVFIRPKLWDDPFENILTLQTRNRRYVDDKYFIYAQCWTFSKENDLLWRSYSPNKDSVKLRSTPRKMIDSIKNSKRICSIISDPKVIYKSNGISLKEEIEGFIGKVKYLSNKRIIRSLRQAFYSDTNSYYEPLFLKRDAFKNEDELRIGLRYSFGYDDIQFLLSPDIFNFDIETSDIIDEIVFDPRISDFKFEALKNQIQQYGYSNPICKSNLYEIPDINKILE